MTQNISEKANCMTVVVGKRASKTGRVLLAHNEDDYIHAKVKHHFVPARDWEEGALLPAEEGKARVPQVKHTYAYAWVEMVGQDGGLSTSDCFINENGVCVVSDSSCGSREDAENPRLDDDGIAYAFRRAVAERAKSAAHALDTACELIEKYGYASSGRIYFFADKDEAYMMQICRGKMYAACRIPDDAIAVMPNHYTIHDLEDCVRYPKEIVSRAVEKGWLNQGEKFDFAKVYQDPKTYRHPENTLRQKYATEILLGREWDMDKDGFPAYVRATKQIGVEELIDVMSAHYEHSHTDVRFGPGATPHETNVRRVCTATTVESMIYEFTDEAIKSTVWTAFGRPCELMYIPLHPLSGETEGLEKREDAYIAASKHLGKTPGDTCYDKCAWQYMQDFQNLIEFKYSERIDEVKLMNETAFRHFSENESKLRCSDSANLNAADALALAYAVQTIRDYRDREPKLEDICIKSAEIFILDGASHAKVEFDSLNTPELYSMLFGPGRTQLSRSYALPVAGSLKKTPCGSWQAEFMFGEAPLKNDGEGIYEFILGGRDIGGKCFCGMTLIKMNADGSGGMQ